MYVYGACFLCLLYGLCGGLWEVCCVAAIVKNCGFEPWSVEVCCMFV